MPPKIYGFVAPGFEAVRDSFAQNFEDGLENGASLCILRKGTPLVDIWAGDAEPGMPWRRDSIVNVFSTTKGAAALACAICADRGLLDYNEKMTKYWPEFGQNGKQDCTVSDALSHQIGVNGIRRADSGPDGTTFAPADLYDWDKTCNQLAKQKPYWTPGTMNGYHAVTYGYLAGELVRRVSGQTIGQFFKENVADKLGVDFYIGVPASEDYRVVPMQPAPNAPPLVNTGGKDKKELTPEQKEIREATITAFANPNILDAKDAVPTMNTIPWRRAEIPAANGHTNGPALARMYCCLANGGELDGVRLLSPGGVRAATKMNCFRKDLILGFRVRWGNGFMLNDPAIGLQGPNEGCFGHAGAGGSLGFADPTHGLGFGYAMTKMSSAVNGDPRTLRIIEALYTCLGQPIRYVRDDKTGMPKQTARMMSANNGNLNGGAPIAARL